MGTNLWRTLRSMYITVVRIAILCGLHADFGVLVTVYPLRIDISFFNRKIFPHHRPAYLTLVGLHLYASAIFKILLAEIRALLLTYYVLLLKDGNLDLKSCKLYLNAIFVLYSYFPCNPMIRSSTSDSDIFKTKGIKPRGVKKSNM